MTKIQKPNRLKKSGISRCYMITTSVGLLLALFSIACRYSTPLADWYATTIYPLLSSLLSLISAWSPYNLEEPAIAAIILLTIAIIILATIRRISWKMAGCRLFSIVLWTYVWFYCGWCINYSRSSLYARTQITPTEFQDDRFKDFAEQFVYEINEAWTNDRLKDSTMLEKNIKAFYASVPPQYGLSTPKSWQHPKKIIANGIYSAVGIQGFMAPLFAESCLNTDVMPDEYPFVYAHEYAHLMGISSEAEANWWAFHACCSTQDAAIRYSGYRGILSHLIRNASANMSEEEYKKWFLKIRPEIIEDLRQGQTHWRQLLSPSLRNMHEKTYDTFLKSNNVSAGRKDYSLVIGLLIDIPFPTLGEL